MTARIELNDLDFAGHVRAGDFVVWGQACGEPLTLTARLMAQRHRIGPFTAFIGISLGDCPDPEHADIVRFMSFCGTGGNAGWRARASSTSCRSTIRSCPAR